MITAKVEEPLRKGDTAILRKNDQGYCVRHGDARQRYHFTVSKDYNAGDEMKIRTEWRTH